jgi:hypothetical protein
MAWYRWEVPERLIGSPGGLSIAMACLQVLLRGLQSGATAAGEKIAAWEGLLNSIFRPLHQPALERDAVLGLWRMAGSACAAYCAQYSGRSIPHDSAVSAVSGRIGPAA